MEYERFNTVVVEYKNSIEAFMRRVFQVLIIWVCIFCLFLNSCSNAGQTVSAEKFEQQAAAYRERIRNADSSLEIHESAHICQDGEHIVVYSVYSPSEACFGVTLTVISPKKSKLLIEFTDADDNWSENNISLFASLIVELTNCEMTSLGIETAIESMTISDHYRFDSGSSLFWDDYHSTLYYTETEAN